MVYNGYYKVMSNIPKMGHLPTPVGSPQIPHDRPSSPWCPPFCRVPAHSGEEAKLSPANIANS